MLKKKLIGADMRDSCGSTDCQRKASIL